MKAHSDFASATIKRIAGRDALRARLEQYDNAAASRVVAVQRLPGDLFFFERRGARDDQFKLFMRRGIDGSDKLLFDSETLKKKTGKPNAINYYTPWPDGQLVVLSVSAAGSEDASLRIIDTATGRRRGPEITRAQIGGVSWAPDGRELYFHRMQALAEGAPPTDKYQRSSMVVMKPGARAAGTRTVLTAGVDLGIPATEFPLLEVLPDGRVLATAADGVSPDFAAWHTTLGKLRAGKPDWQKLVGREDGVTGLAVQGNRVYALTFKGASRFKLLGGPLQGFSPATASALVPESARVLTGLASAQDGLYLEARDGNVKRLFKLAHCRRRATAGSAVVSQVISPRPFHAVL